MGVCERLCVVCKETVSNACVPCEVLMVYSEPLRIGFWLTFRVYKMWSVLTAKGSCCFGGVECHQRKGVPNGHVIRAIICHMIRFYVNVLPFTDIKIAVLMAF